MERSSGFPHTYVIYPSREGVDVEAEAKSAFQQGYHFLVLDWEEPLSIEECEALAQFVKREFPDVEVSVKA